MSWNQSSIETLLTTSKWKHLMAKPTLFSRDVIITSSQGSTVVDLICGCCPRFGAMFCTWIFVNSKGQLAFLNAVYFWILVSSWRGTKGYKGHKALCRKCPCSHILVVWFVPKQFDAHMELLWETWASSNLQSDRLFAAKTLQSTNQHVMEHSSLDFGPGINHTATYQCNTDNKHSILFPCPEVQGTEEVTVGSTSLPRLRRLYTKHEKRQRIWLDATWIRQKNKSRHQPREWRKCPDSSICDEKWWECQHFKHAFCFLIYSIYHTISQYICIITVCIYIYIYTRGCWLSQATLPEVGIWRTLLNQIIHSQCALHSGLERQAITP